MRITQVLILGLLGTAQPVQFAVADADGERAALARISPYGANIRTNRMILLSNNIKDNLFV